MAEALLDDEQTEAPYFWSDLADWLSLEYVGLGGAWDHEALEAYEDERRFALRYAREGRLVGVCSIGGAADLDRARAELAGVAPERDAA